MTKTLRQKSTQNQLLAGLAVDDFAAIQPHVTTVDLPLRKPLQVRNRPIGHAYFLEGDLRR